MNGAASEQTGVRDLNYDDADGAHRRAPEQVEDTGIGTGIRDDQPHPVIGVV